MLPPNLYVEHWSFQLNIDASSSVLLEHALCGFSGLMCLRSSSCATSSIVTNRSRDSSVEVWDCDDDRDRRYNEQGRLPDVLQQPQVGYSTPVSYRAPVGAAPTFHGAELSLQFVWLKQVQKTPERFSFVFSLSMNVILSQDLVSWCCEIEQYHPLSQDFFTNLEE